MIVLSAFLAGCAVPDGGGHSAIEITGYLDAARVAWTQVETEVQAAGREGAASPGSLAILDNEGTGAVAEASVSDLGTFVVAVAAAEGDHLRLRVDDAPEKDETIHDVPAHGPFPVVERVLAHSSHDQADVVVIEVTFVMMQPEGQVWVANSRIDAVVVLDPFDGGHLHGGHITGVAGDRLRLWWVPNDGIESLALEVVVDSGE